MQSEGVGTDNTVDEILKMKGGIGVIKAEALFVDFKDGMVECECESLVVLFFIFREREREVNWRMRRKKR